MSRMWGQFVSLLATWLAFLLDVLFGNPSNALRSKALVEPVVLTARRLEQYQTAQLLSHQVFELKRSELGDYPEFTFMFEDSNDKAMVTFMNGTCYGVFKGAHSNLEDMGQSFGLWGSQEVCGSAGCCHLDQGITRAYESEEIRPFWEEKIRTCASTLCGGNETCPVVLTGHSQGATIATVAAVAVADVNPMLFSFGAQKLIHPFRPCSVLNNMGVYYRTTSICENMGRPAYDVNNIVGAYFGTHTGTMILVGHGGAVTLAHNRDQFLTPYTRKCHDIHDPYIRSIMALKPGPLDGFVKGSMCTRHAECHSKRCVKNQCSAQLVGESR